VLEIERLGRQYPFIDPLRAIVRKWHYVVRDDRGSGGTLTRRGFNASMSGELDGKPYELGHTGRRRKQLYLRQGDVVLARADRVRPRLWPLVYGDSWTITFGDATYELRPKPFRRVMELGRDGSVTGTVRSTWDSRVVIGELPAELSPAVQMFVGFVVLIALGGAGGG
jgi:hypothetical protein